MEDNVGIKYGMDPFAHSITRLPIFILLFLIVLYSYIFTKITQEKIILKIIGISYVIVILYGIFQVISMYHPNEIYSVLNQIIESKWVGNIDKYAGLPYIYIYNRINLFTMEASEAAKLLVSFYYPFIFAASIAQYNIKYLSNKLLFLISLILLVLTMSTSGYIVFILMIVLYLIQLKKYHLILSWTLAFFLIATLFWLFGSEDIKDTLIYLIIDKPTDIEASDSTRSRYALLYASWFMVGDYPFTGVGLGKELFIIENYIPSWGWTWEIKEYIDEGIALGPKSYLFRILVEGGFIVFTIYLFILLKFIYLSKSIKNIFLKNYIIFSLFSHILFGFITGHMYTIYIWFIFGYILAMYEKYNYKQKV